MNNQEKMEPWQDPNIKPLLQIQGVSKKFADTTALHEISLDIFPGEFFALLGPSGCGKSTLLRILAGFEQPTTGQVLLDAEDITRIPVYHRPINMMFQSYALFPHMTVEQNIAFGLKQEGLSRDEVTQRTVEVLQTVQLTSFAKRKPHQLSGGQQQRTALARSLVKRPRLLLLDEPLGALDKKLREETQFELVELQESLDMTFVIVTHDQEEAMTVACRIAIMGQGRVAQLGTPIEIYEYPKSRSVASFVGEMNILEGKLKSRSQGEIFIDSDIPGTKLAVKDSPKHYSRLQLGDSMSYAIRPEKIRMEKIIDSEKKKPAAINTLQGTVVDIAYLGNRSVFYVKLDTGQMVSSASSNLVRQEYMQVTWNDRVSLQWDATSGMILTD